MQQATRSSAHPCRGSARSTWNCCCMLAAAALGAAACSGDPAPEPPDAGAETPTILVTTSIWADVVANVACDGLADVEGIIPVGSDPHGYEPSLQDTERMTSASLVVANGLTLEGRLENTLAAVAESGTPVLNFAEHMDPIPYESEAGHHDEHEGHDEHEDEHDEHDEHEGHDEHEDEHEGHDEHDEHDEHEDEHEGHDEHDEHDEHEDEHEGHDEHDEHDEDEGHDEHGHHDHDHGTEDPHVWLDPHRVAEALPVLAQALTADAGLDPAAVEACLVSYQAELEAVDAEMAEKVEQLPAESRKLVTNHDAFEYYAARYGFEVIGVVIPSPSSLAEANPAGLEELAEIIEHEGIKAIFAETQHSSDEITALAAQVGDVEVVTLYTGTLGPPGSGAETYTGYLRTNTDLIVDSLN